MAVLAIVFAAAFAQRNASWGAEVAASYARGGTFDGPGVAAQVLWAPTTGSPSGRWSTSRG
jgi:hypothetical protein